MSENATRDRQPLLRDRNQKMIAGVCTGLGRHLDIDPVVFRILFAVLTFFGGLGILAYAACWLLIPATGEDSSEAQRLLTGPNVYVAAGAAALMVLGLLWFTDILADRFDHSLPIVLAGAAAIGVVVWHRENRGNPADPGSRRDAPGSGPTPGNPFAQAQAWWQRPVADHSPSTTGGPSIPEPFASRPSGDSAQAAESAAPGTATARTSAEEAPGAAEPAEGHLGSGLSEPADSEPAEEFGAAEIDTAPDADMPSGKAAGISEQMEPADRIEPAAPEAKVGPADSDAEEAP